jgi:hypothetical protein
VRFEELDLDLLIDLLFVIDVLLDLFMKSFVDLTTAFFHFLKLCQDSLGIRLFAIGIFLLDMQHFLECINRGNGLLTG